MKKKITHKFLFSSIIFLSLLLVLASSCHRNKDCDVVINVVNGTTNAPVLGATVHMYIPPNAPPGSNLQMQDQTGVTDGSGSVSFTFKLPAILQADVTPPSPFAAATALVKLEEGKQVSKTIKVY